MQRQAVRQLHRQHRDFGQPSLCSCQLCCDPTRKPGSICGNGRTNCPRLKANQMCERNRTLSFSPTSPCPDTRSAQNRTHAQLTHTSRLLCCDRKNAGSLSSRHCIKRCDQLPSIGKVNTHGERSIAADGVRGGAKVRSIVRTALRIADRVYRHAGSASNWDGCGKLTRLTAAG